MCSVIDTIPAFIAYWAANRRKEAQSQLDAWAGRYMASWPDLLKLQLDAYAEDGLDWRQAAAAHVLPVLDKSMPEIFAAHQILTACAPTVVACARARLPGFFPVTLVYYVGVGLGAGWAAYLEGRPAILYGLENIAACRWANALAISGLTAHEYAHLWHMERRRERGLSRAPEPWWSLYEEGLAAFIENYVLGRPSWHMQSAQPGWLAWCRSHRAWLAGEYLRYQKEGLPITPFYGTWYNLGGYQQTGYFLGHELIARFAAEMPLEMLALWNAEEIKARTRQGLIELAVMQN
ncbi:MAG: hypothetical protein ACYC6L_00825 [Anaerolineae bacterium]